MKKLKILVFQILVLTMAAGCTSKPPLAPEPKGEFTPVNPDNIHIKDLKV